MGFFNLLICTLVGVVMVWVFHGLALREAYLSLGLAPYGSKFVLKDMASYLMTSLPRIARTVKTGTDKFDLRGDTKRHAQLEGFHTTLEFSESVLQPSKLCESKYFAENYYFWVSDATSQTDFLLTTRLSFYGTNASRVIPWFTFQLDGEEWNLPQAFSPQKHELSSLDRVAVDVKGLGKLEFENIIPMKEWRLRYKGKVENRNRTKQATVNAEFTLHFSEKDVFSYQLHWDEMATALALAGKQWDSEFFKNLRAQNQERYASRAHLATGFVHFENSTTGRLDLPTLQASRDHLWGIRNWVFMPRYIWWPPITLKEPLVIEGVKYTSFIGAFVEYGNTMDNMVVGGLVSDEGEVASFSGATHMRDIAPRWYDEPPKREFIGEKLVPGDLKLDIGLLSATYVMEVQVERGTKHGLWTHTFSLAEGDFEIHEALARFKFTVRRTGESTGIVAKSTAMGLFEFGATVVPVTVYDG